MVLARIQKSTKMNLPFPVTMTNIKTLVEILIDLHLLAMLIVNTTKSPESRKIAPVNFTYRLIEILAGLVTPLAKR